VIVKQTISFCPECYKEIPAVIDVDQHVNIIKKCSEHGEFSAMVERDPVFYMECMTANANNIYNGYFLDVTERCNLNCQYCFYHTTNKTDPSIDALKSDAMINAHRAPIILTGGEPSLRKDLPEIIAEISQIAPVELLTNGTSIDIDSVLPMLTNENGTVNINLSIHPEAHGEDIKLINTISEMGKKLESVLFVIDEVDQIDGILAFGLKYKHAIESIRIKAATKLWDEQKPENKIFVSDMLNHAKQYNPEPLWWRNNKTSFFNFMLDGVIYMAVSWYDVENVDLLDIDCPPFYRARNGQIENIVTACLINEGMDKGWLNGRMTDG
jgi:organic radical activating enzyme